uniref:Predicted protein n=1 Tax=Hordeum vulgare subsp. vulgare TaxID=112509 RepID=F2CVL3_HORVV|nr:predicted protein [Hordeum vulgare subsp. vulgare]
MIMATMRCLRPGGARRRQCPLLAAFCSSLVDGLAHLEATLSAEDDDGGGGSAVSMRWCADAMRLVRRMQRDLLAVFRSADAPVTVDAGSCAGEDWLEQYMQETAALLDFCNAFKSAVSRMHRYCMVVDFAAQVGCAGAGGIAASLVAESTAPSSPAATVRGNLSDVKAVVSEAERLGGKIISSSGGSGSMVLVTLVAKITMAVVATSVLHALTHASPPSLLEDERRRRRRAPAQQHARPRRGPRAAASVARVAVGDQRTGGGAAGEHRGARECRDGGEGHDRRQDGRIRGSCGAAEDEVWRAPGGGGDVRLCS